MFILFFILILYAIPILYIILKKKIGLHKLDKFISDKYLTIALFYLLLTTTLLPILTSLLALSDKDFLEGLDSITLLIIIFALLIIGLSLHIEYVFRQLSSRFKVLPDGYMDENTGVKNISLRHETFIDLIKGIDSGKLASISKIIGKDFGATIVEKHTIKEFSKLKEHWEKTDGKSSFLTKIEFSTPNNILGIINITNSFAKQANEREKKYEETNLCLFLENYSNGIMEAFYEKNASFDKKNLKLSKSVCNKCEDGNDCSLVITE